MPLSRQCMANFYLMLSIAAFIAPKNHTLQQSYLDLQKSQQLWFDRANRILKSITAQEEENTSLLEQVVCSALQAQRSLLLGNIEPCWYAIGQAIRKGVTIHLFHHATCVFLDQEVWRCSQISSLASFLVHTDRWICFNRDRPFGIASQYVRLFGHESMSTTPGARILHTLEACHDLQQYFQEDSPLEVVSFDRGQRLFKTIQTDFVASLAYYGLPRDLLSSRKEAPLSDLLPLSLDSAATASITQLIAAFLYIQCFIGLHFLEDNHAPMYLQEWSIEAADSLVRLIPILWVFGVASPMLYWMLCAD